MSDGDFPDPDTSRLAEEAARIFVLLQADPKDSNALARREAFLAKGPEARKVWDKMVQIWDAVGEPKRNPLPKLLIGALALGLIGALAAEPIGITLRADHATGDAPEAVQLRSADIAVLDASSAVIDDTDEDTRRVRLMKGAAYFEVTTAERPFEVMTGGLTVRVTGTAFEVARFEDAVSVTVAEGSVSVLVEGAELSLGAGDHLRWSVSGPVYSERLEETDVAGWRSDLLLAESMPFGDLVEIIERRLGGSILVVGETLAQTRIGGPVDLSDPWLALRTLTAAAGARITWQTPLGAVIWQN